jgi:transposase-like protein
VGLIIDLNAERKRREGLAAAMEAMSVTEFCPACWHRPYLHRKGLRVCGLCGCAEGFGP